MFSIDKKKSLETFFDNSNKTSNLIIKETYEDSEIGNNTNDDHYDDESVEPKDYEIEPYYFLPENNNPLSQVFGVFNDTENKVYNIHLCIYRINKDCKIPFIEFLVDIDDMPQFPNVPNFSCPNIVETDEDSEEQDTYFMNKCLIKLLEVLKLHEIFGVELLDKMYKGFVQHDDSNIFVVFECFAETDFHPKVNVQWIILDEILFKKDVNQKPIDPLMTTFFEKQEYMTELYTDETYRHQYPLPFLMYLCDKDDIHYTVSRPSIIDITILGVPWLGNGYYFSSKKIQIEDATITDIQALEKDATITDIQALEKDTTISDIKAEKDTAITDPKVEQAPEEIQQKGYQRYALFTVNANYILRDVSQCTQQQIDSFLEKNMTKENLATYYNDNGLCLWCVKNSDSFTRL
jgi:hypothetical protein